MVSNRIKLVGRATYRLVLLALGGQKLLSLGDFEKPHRYLNQIADC
jgi:hypothetical protein